MCCGFPDQSNRLRTLPRLEPCECPNGHWLAVLALGAHSRFVLARFIQLADGDSHSSSRVVPPPDGNLDGCHKDGLCYVKVKAVLLENANHTNQHLCLPQYAKAPSHGWLRNTPPRGPFWAWCGERARERDRERERERDFAQVRTHPGLSHPCNTLSQESLNPQSGATASW